ESPGLVAGVIHDHSLHAGWRSHYRPRRAPLCCGTVRRPCHNGVFLASRERQRLECARGGLTPVAYAPGSPVAWRNFLSPPVFPFIREGPAIPPVGVRSIGWPARLNHRTERTCPHAATQST